MEMIAAVYLRMKEARPDSKKENRAYSMKRNSHYSLAALIHLAIWGAALHAQAADISKPEEAKDADTAAAKTERRW